MHPLFCQIQRKELLKKSCSGQRSGTLFCGFCLQIPDFSFLFKLVQRSFMIIAKRPVRNRFFSTCEKILSILRYLRVGESCSYTGSHRHRRLRRHAGGGPPAL
jgi:hypothetical protein